MVKSFCQYARTTSMIDTKRTTRGMIIKVTNYDRYQTLDNYKYDEATTTPTTSEPRANHEPTTTINKNGKNGKNGKKKGASKEKLNIQFYETKGVSSEAYKEEPFKKNPIKKNWSSKEKRFYNPTKEEMRFYQRKWWVVPKDGGSWLEFAGNLVRDTFTE